MASSQYQKAVEEAKAQIDSIIEKMKALDKEIIDVSNSATKMARAMKSGGFSEMANAIKLQTALLEKMNSKITTQTSNVKRLTAAKQNYQKAAKKTSYLMEMSKLKSQGFNKSVKEQAILTSKSTTEIEKLTVKLNQARRAYENAALSGKKSAQEIAKLEAKYRALSTQLETQKAKNKAVESQAKLTAQAHNTAGNAISRLNAQMKLAQQAYQSAIVSGNASAKQLAALRQQYVMLANKVNAAKAATQSFSSKSGLGGLISGIKQMASAFGIAGAAFLAADLIRKSFNLAKRLQALDFALQAVTKTQHQFGRAQAFVSDISNKFGADILSVTERYTKFLAAAQQSGVAVSDTEKIFSTMTKASGVLGLKTDELTGVYLALEQMMSKGKVTTEELRRQLGERLPGAFGIMADALGVSMPKLDEMLKKGQIMSADVLPKFAEEVQKAFGLDAYDSIETIQAAQNRVNNAFVEMIHLFTEGGMSQTVMDVLNGIAAAMQFIRKGIEFVSPAFKDLRRELQFSVQGWKDLINEIDPSGKLLERIGNIVKWLTKGPFVLLRTTLQTLSVLSAGLGRALQELVRSWSNLDFSTPIENFKSLIGLTGRMKDAFSQGIEDFKAFQKEMDKKEAIKNYNNELKQTAILMVALSKARGGNMTVEEAQQMIVGKTLKQLQEMQDEYSKLLNIEKKYTENKEGEIKAMKGSIAWYDDEIKKKQELLDKTALTAEEVRKFAREIEVLSKFKEGLEVQVELAIASGKKVDVRDFMSGLPDDAYEAAQSVYQAISEAEEERVRRSKELHDELTAYQGKKIAEQYAKEKKAADDRIEIARALFDSFSEYYDIDFEKFSVLIDEKKNTTGQWVDAANEAAKAYLNARLQVYEIELQEAQRSRDLILNNDLATEEQKEEARRKYREEEARIRTERAKAERENALIQVAIDTASAIVKATAQTGVLAPFVIPGIIAIGLAQAALIASQPLPKFAEGHLSGTHEGPAVINDAKRSDYQEVVKRRDGSVEVYKDRNQVVNMSKGDKVYKSLSQFAQMNGISDVVMLNAMSDSKELSFASTGDRMISEVSLMRSDMKATMSELKTIAKRPINVKVSNKIQMPVKRKYL